MVFALCQTIGKIKDFLEPEQIFTGLLGKACDGFDKKVVILFLYGSSRKIEPLLCALLPTSWDSTVAGHFVLSCRALKIWPDAGIHKADSARPPRTKKSGP